MDRRSSFKSLAIGAAAFLWSGCKEIYGSVSRWSWPRYPSEAALRSHLKRSPKHPGISAERVNKMTFEQLIRWHDRDHGIRRRDRPRWKKPKKVPGT